MQNNTGSAIANAGIIQFTGDFTNAAAASSVSGSGLLRFSSATDQLLTTPAGTASANLEVPTLAPPAATTCPCPTT